DVRRDATRAAAAPGGPRRRVLPVHWSGCGRRCGQPSGAVVEVVATTDGYRVRRAALSSTAAPSAAMPVSSLANGDPSASGDVGDTVLVWASGEPGGPGATGGVGEGCDGPRVADWAGLVAAVAGARALHRGESG
ncbi:hypothetical protein ND747_19025, partial [Frankia sp. R82]|nr:hypothetical protein [Frankia sp. R82]